MTIAAGSQDDKQRRAALWLLACLGVLAIQVLVQHLMGRLWICECGYIKLWEGVVKSSGNSQHLSDWYTPSMSSTAFSSTASVTFSCAASPGARACFSQP